MGLITSAALIGGVLTVLPGGWLTDVWGVRRLVAGSLVFIAIAGLGISFANSLIPFLALAFLVGVGTGPVFPATSRAVMDWLPPRRRGMAMGIKQTGPPITGAITAATLPTIAAVYGWRAGPLIMAAMVGLVIIVTLTLYKDKPSAGVGVVRMSWRGLGELARDRGYRHRGHLGHAIRRLPVRGLHILHPLPGRPRGASPPSPQAPIWA